MEMPSREDAARLAAANQARVADLHRSLMDSGYYGVADLARLREQSLEEVGQWLESEERAGQVFAVEIDGMPAVPAVLLDRELEPIAAWEPVLRVLFEFRVTGWSRWSWIATPCAWLDGEVPSELLESDPERVRRAAERKLESLAG